MGFPSRISRLALGPKRSNRAPVQNHEFFIDATYLNLLMWQTAGMNVCAPRAFAYVNAAGTLVASGEAWDPNGLVVPTVARPSTGTYTITYDATYDNELGVSVALDLIGADAKVQGTDPAIVAAQRVTSNRVVEVYIEDGGVAANADFIVWVF